MNPPYAALWVNLSPDGKSIRMACDNENNDESNHWQVPYANCIEVQNRFYCAGYGLRPYMNGFELHARICKLKDITISNVENVARLFSLSIAIANSIGNENDEGLKTRDAKYHLFIWDKAEQSLARLADGEILTIGAGNYRVSNVSLPLSDIAPNDEYAYFQQLRAQLNTITEFGLRDWPDIRAKFDQWESGDWMYQGITGDNIPDEIVDALLPLIQSHLV